MDHIDETIIQAKRQHLKSQYKDIAEGVYIGEKFQMFERRDMFDEKMSVMLPADYQIMDEQSAKMKYPSEQRPQIIYTNIESDVNFTFSLYDMPITTNQLPQAIDQFQLVIKKVQPANIFYEKKVDTYQDICAGWFDFKSYAIDDQIYTLMYVAPIEEKVMHGIFNCRFSACNDWKSTVLQVIGSIVDLTKKRH